MENQNKHFQLKTPLINSGGGSFNPSTDLTVQHILKVVSPNPAGFMNDSGMTTIIQNMITAAMVNSATKNDITTVLEKLKDEATTRAAADTSIRQEINQLATSTTLSIESINALIAAKSKLIDGLRTDLTALAARVTKTETDIYTINNSITTINGAVSALNTKVSNLETAVATNTTNINNNKTAIATNAQEIVFLKNSLENKLDKITFQTHLTEFENEKNKLQTLTTRVDNIKVTVDKHDAILNGTKKMSEIEADIDGLQTSVYNVTQKVDTYDSKISAIEADNLAINTFITDNTANILHIPTIDAKANANATDIVKIYNAIGNVSPMENGYLPWEYVRVFNTSDFNTGWLDNVANQFKVGSALLNENFPIVLSRINTNASTIKANAAALATLTGRVDLNEINIQKCLDGISAIPGINDNIAIIKDKLVEHTTQLETLEKKTVYLDTDGIYPENRVSLDQTAVENWNTDTTGTAYLGSQIIAKDLETSKFSLFTILDGFYHRLSQLKVISDNSDLATLLTRMTDIETEVDDVNTALQEEDKRIIAIIDALSDFNIKSSNTPASLNKWGANAAYNYDQEDVSLYIEDADTLKEVIAKTQNRIFQLKELHYTYTKFGLPGNKINANLNESEVNFGIDGNILPSTDALYIDTLETIDEVALKLKKHIDLAYKTISELKIKIDPFTVSKVDGVTTVTTNGNHNVTGKLSVTGKSDFDADISVDGIVKANELYLSGRKIVLDTAVASNTVRDSLSVLTNTTTSGLQIIDRSGTSVMSGSTALTLEPVVIGTHVGLSDRSKKSYSIIEKLDHVSIDFYYSFLVDLTSVANGRLVYFDFIIKDNRTVTLTDELSKKLASIEERYTKGFDIDVTTNYSIGHYGMAFPNSEINGRTSSVSKPVIPKLTNVQLGSSTGVYTGEQRFDITQSKIISEPNTKIIVSEADYKTLNMMINGGYKTLMFMKSALSVDDSEFFVNMVVRSKIYKKEWV